MKDDNSIILIKRTQENEIMNIKEILEDYIADLNLLIEIHGNFDKLTQDYYINKRNDINNYLECIKCKEDFNYFKENYISVNNENRNKQPHRRRIKRT